MSNAESRDAAAGAAQPRASLSVFDAVAMIVGIVIGAGIFRAPSIVAGNVSGETMLFLLWLGGGLISLVGALCYAELASAYPSAGGEYFFLTRAFGGWVGFLFAWARMSVVQTGAIAAVAFVFGDYASQLYSFGEHSSAVWAAIAVALCTALNVAGTAPGKWLQNALTVTLVLAYAAIIVTAVLYSPPVAPAAFTPPSDPGIGLAMIFILLTYGGWNEGAYLSAELRGGRRDIVRALVLAIALVTLLYLLMNYAYYHVLGLKGMAESKVIAADMMKLTLGSAGAAVLAAIIVLETLTTLNGSLFTGARTNYAVGRDFALFHFLGRWGVRSNAPVAGLLWQGAIALALVGLASLTPDGFQTMVAYTAPAFWLFFLLTGGSLFVLRRRVPLAADPFRVPLYPLTPILFCAMCAYMLYSSASYAMSLDPGSVGAKIGIGMLLAGIPLLFFARPTSIALMAQRRGQQRDGATRP